MALKPFRNIYWIKLSTKFLIFYSIIFLKVGSYMYTKRGKTQPCLVSNMGLNSTITNIKLIYSNK